MTSFDGRDWGREDSTLHFASLIFCNPLFVRAGGVITTLSVVTHPTLGRLRGMGGGVCHLCGQGLPRGERVCVSSGMGRLRYHLRLPLGFFTLFDAS